VHRPPQCYQRGQLLDEAGISNQLQLPAFRKLYAPLVGEGPSALGLPNSSVEVRRRDGCEAYCRIVVWCDGGLSIQTVWLVVTLLVLDMYP